jgi:hypothetical protein
MSGNGGWVKLHRKLLGSGVFTDDKALKVWVWCLLKATHKPLVARMSTGRGEVKVHLKPGQFAFGRNQAARELGMPGSTIWRKIVDRQMDRQVDIQTDRHYTIITICNWDKYQNDKIPDGQACGQASETKCGHIQEEENKKNCILPLDTSETNYTSETSDTFALGVQKRNERFKIFWNAYPKKRSKGQAEKTWKKLDPDDALLEQILAGIERAKASHEWTKIAPDGGNFIPYPSTWLNAKGWEDEHEHEGKNRRAVEKARSARMEIRTFKTRVLSRN